MGTAAGAVAALVMAFVWCAISHLVHRDASLPVRAIAAVVLGQPPDDDPRRTAVAIALGLVVHFAIGMTLGRAFERAFRAHRPPRGSLLALTLGWALLLSSFPLLERIAPDFLEAVPPPSLLAGHLLFGTVLEVAYFLYPERTASQEAAPLRSHVTEA